MAHHRTVFKSKQIVINGIHHYIVIEILLGEMSDIEPLIAIDTAAELLTNQTLTDKKIADLLYGKDNVA